MRALPDEGLEAFEGLLRSLWSSRDWYRARGALACSLGLLGLRWSEVEVCEGGDLDVDGGRLYVRTRKRGRPRWVEAPEDLLQACLTMRGKVAGGANRVFVRRTGRACNYHDLRRAVERLTTAAFGRAFSFHCFRHTAAVRVYRRTHDVLAVQRYLGHKSLMWTNAYLQSLEVVDVGGPIAFAGGGKAGVRVFDPEGSAVADHVCLDNLRPLRSLRPGWNFGRCEVCQLVWTWSAADRSDARAIEGSQREREVGCKGTKGDRSECENGRKAALSKTRNGEFAGRKHGSGEASPAAEREKEPPGAVCLHPRCVQDGTQSGRARFVCAECGAFVGFAPVDVEGDAKASAGQRPLFN